MSNISMKESPIWLKSILLKSDIKPINVVVDITNYLMILTGQPLHAFDYDKVIKTDTAQADMAHIVIRTAKPKESIHALDGNIYELNDRNLVIANSENPIALAGAIGGKETEIDENTTNIILESANFDKYNLRRTSMDLGIVTDASTRFTRSQSPQLCDKVISKAAQLIKELAKGELSSTLIDSYPVPRDSKIVTINIEKMREKLGIDISNENVINLLENIEYNIIEIKENYLTIEVPPFRQDIEIEEDIYEDIIRIYGYEKITPILPTKKIHATTRPAINKIKQEIRSILANSGANELISYSFTNTELLNLVNQNIDDCYKIKNPLSKDLELMRPSIIQSLLEKAQLNIQQGIETFSIFEMGISHQKGLLDKDNLPLEEWKLSYLFTDSKNLIDGNSYYEAKRYLEKVLYQFTGNPLHYTLLADSDFENLPKWIKSISGSFEPNSSAIVEIKVGDSKITLGIVGEISTTVQKNLSLNNFTSGFEINLEKLSQLQTNSTTEILIESKYPYITQDICFIVPNKITYSELYKIVTKSIDKDKVRFDIKCLDIYQKDDNKDRNITLRISISNTEKTLNDKDFQKIREKLEKNIKKKNISMLQ
jgi:phenylalanyl-tRNA synthetase beta chain